MESLIRGEAADPEDARIPYARATILAQLGRKAEAVAATRRVLELNPESRDARELLNELQAR